MTHVTEGLRKRQGWPVLLWRWVQGETELLDPWPLGHTLLLHPLLYFSRTGASPSRPSALPRSHSKRGVDRLTRGTLEQLPFVTH